MADLFRAFALNNAWSNHRLLSACAALAPDEVIAPRTGFFPSLAATLNHIHIVDLFYISALEGACVGTAAFDREMPYPAIADLAPAQAALDARLVAVTEESALARPDRPVTLIRAGGDHVERFDRTFMHLIQHQIHHRGQAHAMLSETSVAPPQLDEFFLEWEADRRRRAPDLAAMGLTEADIGPRE